MTPRPTLGSPPRSPVLPASPVERCRGRPHARPSPLELRRDGKKPGNRKPGTRAQQHHATRAVSMPARRTTTRAATPAAAIPQVTQPPSPAPAAPPAPLDNTLLRWWAETPPGRGVLAHDNPRSPIVGLVWPLRLMLLRFRHICDMIRLPVRGKAVTAGKSGLRGGSRGARAGAKAVFACSSLLSRTMALRGSLTFTRHADTSCLCNRPRSLLLTCLVRTGSSGCFRRVRFSSFSATLPPMSATGPRRTATLGGSYDTPSHQVAT